MRRLDSGYFSAAYVSTDGKKIILFSIDPTKDVMCDVIKEYDSIHYPQIEKVGDERVRGFNVGIYRMERLIPIGKFRDNRDYISLPRQKIVDDYETLDSLLFGANIKQKDKLSKFNLWMDKLENNPHVAKYVPALRDQHDSFYNAYGEDLNFDYHDMNVSVRPYKNDLVFSDIYAVAYLIRQSDYRIRRYLDDQTLRSVYTE